MKHSVDDARLQRRLSNLDRISKTFSRNRRLAAENTLHQEMIEKALTMMSSKQLRAFDLSEESADTRAGYGDSRFGRGCLIARRLVQTGVRAIEVTLDGFDTHIGNHDGHVTQSKILDPALASLIADLKRRDLLESTIVLCLGEFGRTPKINPAGGRDHWPHGFSCLVGGGGLAGGLVLGATSPDPNDRKPLDPVRIPDLYATIMTAMGVDPAEQELSRAGRPIAWTDDGSIVKRLLRE